LILFRSVCRLRLQEAAYSAMPAYIVVDNEITDSERYADYVKIAAESIARHGGLYLARGGRTERLEVAWHKTKGGVETPALFRNCDRLRWAVYSRA
jgi:hypothetical protein